MSDPLEVEIAGRKLRCSHCESDVFFHKTEIVQTGPEVQRCRAALGGLSCQRL